MRRNQIPQAAGLREMKFYLEAREAKARKGGRKGRGRDGEREGERERGDAEDN